MEVPAFDDFDAINPIRTSRSYKMEAVRGLKSLLARHVSKAKPIDPTTSPAADIVMLRKNNVLVCRLYVGDDWIGFQKCDPRDSDWSQPIYASAMDAEDKRVIHVFLRY